MRKLTIYGLVAWLAVGLACADEGTTVTEIQAEGAVAGVVWLDRNGNDTRDPSDGPVRDVVVEFFAGPGAEPAFTGRSGAEGEFSVTDMPVGDYQVRVDSATAGDSVRVLRIDSATITVTTDQVTDVEVGFTYPTLPVTTARQEPLDTRLFVEGRALNAWDVFGDSTVHVRDTTGAVRAVRMPPTSVGAGDSIRLQGAVSLRTGQPVLRDGRIFVIETGVESPPPDTVDAATAAAADGGLLDADLVHLDSVVIRDTTINALGEITYIVDDTSGTVSILLDRSARIRLSFRLDVIGNILDVTGLLVPTETGDWITKPRSRDDVVVGPLSYPVVPIDTARQEPPDTRLIVQGLALNAWNAFGDSTLHVADSTGAIRGLRVDRVSVAAGDSIEVLGTTTTAFGQPVLRDVRVSVVSTGVVSPPGDSIATATAADAALGELDADLVRIAGATVQDTSQTADNDVVLTVDDGSGAVDVVLDREITFFLDAGSVTGKTVDATGLLVPSRSVGGVWVLKPRRNEDIVVQ